MQDSYAQAFFAAQKWEISGFSPIEPVNQIKSRQREDSHKFKSKKMQEVVTFDWIVW